MYVPIRDIRRKNVHEQYGMIRMTPSHIDHRASSSPHVHQVTYCLKHCLVVTVVLHIYCLFIIRFPDLTKREINAPYYNHINRKGETSEVVVDFVKRFLCWEKTQSNNDASSSIPLDSHRSVQERRGERTYNVYCLSDESFQGSSIQFNDVIELPNFSGCTLCFT